MKFFALVTLFNNDQTESTKKLKDIWNYHSQIIALM